MKPPEKVYAKVTARHQSWILRSPFAALISHWVFQGMLYMDRTERLFKLGLDLIGIVFFATLLREFTGVPLTWMTAFVLAHTINFIFNGQMWVVLKFYGVTRTSSVFNRYVDGFAKRARAEESIVAAIVYGSLVRREWLPSSDLDVRLLRKPGFANGLRACWFLLTERTRAFFYRFPLDAYVIDRVDSLSKLRDDEQGFDLINQEVFSIRE